MHIIIGSGEEAKIEIGSEILVEGIPVIDNSLIAVKINGYDIKNVYSNIAVALNNEDSEGLKNEKSVIGKVVRFQGINKLIVQFTGDLREINLNDSSDILKVIKT